MVDWLTGLFAGLLVEEKLKSEVSKYFPLCPFCSESSVSAKTEFWSGEDQAICSVCGAKWHLYRSPWSDQMKWAELVMIGTEGGANLLGARHEPKFWRDMAFNNQKLKRRAENEIPQKMPVREIIKEKEIIVKIRCSYCKYAYTETFEKCPNCGAQQ